jgi:hypothetical protein
MTDKAMSEREAFEVWFRKEKGWFELPLSLDTGEWDAWQARAILAASEGQTDRYRSYFGDKHPGDVHQELLSAYAEIERLKVAAPAPAAAQTIGGSHESAGTKPIGTVTVSTMEQDERGALDNTASSQP